MREGDVLGGRFELEREARTGGMGTVWRARDLADGGAPVAVKVMHERASLHRLAREAEVLASLGHPGIVRRLGHGVGFIAMEWLDGHDLEARLAGEGLTMEEAVTLLTRAADALAAAHARGVVHRDLKPSNLFLVEGDPSRVKVLDFGVARARAMGEPLTRIGAIVGTPSYMAPEQARGDPEVDARADVFSLGCVLFECVTGRAPFVGDHPVAVLAKILLEKAPRLSEVVAVPPALDALVARMLSKDPAERSADAAALREELAGLGPLGTRGLALATARAASLGASEQRLATVLLVERARRPEAPTLVADGPADLDGGDDGDAEDVRATVDAPGGRPAALRGEPADALGELVRSHGGRLHALAGGALVAVLDEPVAGAACALGASALFPDRRLALATGRAELDGRTPVGEAIDRAAQLFKDAEAGAVRLDELTAALLHGRYAAAGGLLLGPTPEKRERRLMGKPTPCVGRDTELALLESNLRACGEDGTAQAVVVTGVAGVGKSRLRYELLRRAGPGVQTWLGHGEPMGMNAARAMISQILRAEAGVHAGEPLAVRRAKIEQRVKRQVLPPDAARVSEFLCEIAGAPVGDDRASLFLRSAREDPVAMSDQVKRAWVDLIEAQTDEGPLLIVLEDLHWGDAASVMMVDEALRLCAERPLLVVALGRPETLERFPDLFAARGVQHVQLRPLRRQPAERLARAVLGDGAPAERVASLVDRAGGNAFFLEELLREAAEGRDETPETVLAMLLARIGGMEPEARRVLRAASIFGDEFPIAGVHALSGEGRTTETAGWLDELVRREVLDRGDEAHRFRHSLVREAAYASLIDPDRTLGHRLAAEWLEREGETDGAILAGHFERGSEPARARPWLLRAAEQAIEASDYEGALAATARTRALGADGEELGRSRLLEAWAHNWRGAHADEEGAAVEALGLLPAGSDAWLEAVGRIAHAASALGHHRQLLDAAAAVLGHPSDLDRFAETAAEVAVALLLAGHGEPAAKLLDRAERALGESARARALACRARAWQALREGDTGEFLTLERAELRTVEEAGHRRTACSARVNVGYALLQLGRDAEAEVVLGDALAEADGMALAHMAAFARHNLGQALARLGRIDEARFVETVAALAFRAQGDRRGEGGSRVYLAQMLLLAGDLAAAEDEATSAAAILQAAPPLRPLALATLSTVLLARGRGADALVAAREAAAALQAGVEDGEALVRLALARALDATGDRAAACDAISAARSRLLQRAAKIRDPELRESTLARVPEHRETLALAGSWLDEDR